MITKKLIIATMCCTLCTTVVSAKDTLVFGAISTVKPSKTAKKMRPLLDYLSQKTGKKIIFKTGKTYQDTIDKFNNGTFDFGYIGPSPYVIATKNENNLKILAGLETNNKPYFYGVIIAKKDNNKINKIKDIKGKKFAFGSKKSTLSFFVPAKILIDNKVLPTLEKKGFLGKHDNVVRNVVTGKYDAGGIKESVANKNLDRVKIIKKSEPIYDFLMIAHKNLDNKLSNKIKNALLELKDKDVLKGLKKKATGFIRTKDSNYNGLRKIMADVEKNFK
jgi:phosphonate transport system substrate-binding protein